MKILFWNTQGEILNNFIATSRARRLREFKKYSSDNTVRSTSRSFPLISTQMGSFFGFIDQDFRKYDFYIGMLDAWFYINGLIKREGSVIKNISRPDKQWAPFHCLQSFSNSKRFMGKCSLLRKNGELEPEYENIHKLFQLSLILLYDRCSQNKLRVKVENQICNKISA